MIALRRFHDAAAFATATEPFLVASEAANNLVLGITSTLLLAADQPREAPYLALLARGDSVLGVAIRTPPQNLVLSRCNDLAALDPLVADLRDQPLPGVTGPVPVAAEFAARWSATHDIAARRAMAQRIYQLQEVRPVHGVPGELRRMTPADRPLVEEWIHAFTRDATPDAASAEVTALVTSRLAERGSALYLWWHADRPVSLVGWAGRTPHGVRVGPVYTPPARRGHGYASAAVAALSQLLLEGGRRCCFLFTDLANPTSNRIYQAIGYEPVCDQDLYTFASR